MELVLPGVLVQVLAVAALLWLGRPPGMQALRTRGDGQREPVDGERWEDHRRSLTDAMLLVLALGTTIALAGIARL